MTPQEVDLPTKASVRRTASSEIYCVTSSQTNIVTMEESKAVSVKSLSEKKIIRCYFKKIIYNPFFCEYFLF
jgi:hypothetical protein